MAICKKVERKTIEATINGQEMIIERYNVITTEIYVHTVWVKIPSQSIFDSSFSTLHHFNDVLYGSYNTYFDSARFASLKAGTTERSEAVQAFFAQRKAELHEILRNAFPYLRTCDTVYEGDCDIEVMADEIVAAESAAAAV